jgi:hypothetical protein
MVGWNPVSHITNTHNMVIVRGSVGRVTEVDFGTAGLEVVLPSLLKIRQFHL